MELDVPILVKTIEIMDKIKDVIGEKYSDEIEPIIYNALDDVSKDAFLWKCVSEDGTIVRIGDSVSIKNTDNPKKCIPIAGLSYDNRVAVNTRPRNLYELHIHPDVDTENKIRLDMMISSELYTNYYGLFSDEYDDKDYFHRKLIHMLKRNWKLNEITSKKK